MQCFVLRQLVEEFPPVEASWSSPLDECQGLTRDEMELQVVRRQRGNTRGKRWKMEVQEVHEVRWIFTRCYRQEMIFDTRNDMKIGC